MRSCARASERRSRVKYRNRVDRSGKSEEQEPFLFLHEENVQIGIFQVKIIFWFSRNKGKPCQRHDKYEDSIIIFIGNKVTPFVRWFNKRA